MSAARANATTSRRTVSLVAVFAVLVSLTGVFAHPVAASPVLAVDTLQSGAGFAFGRNDFGQAHPGTTANQLGAYQLPTASGAVLKDAVSFAAGNGFVVWADHLGKVWSLGDNGSGQHGNGTTGGTSTVPLAASGFGGTNQPRALKVSAFGLGVDVLDSNGDVWQWGQVVNNNSTLAIQSSPNKLSFPTGTARIIDVSAGGSFSVAMDQSFKAYAWGKNDRGQLGTNSTNTSPYPTAVLTGTGKLPSTVNGTANLEAGKDFAVYTVSGPTGVEVYTWGAGTAYQLGNNSNKADVKSPARVACFPSACGTSSTLKVLSLSAGGSHALLLTNDGVTRTWGSNGVAVYGTPTLVTHSTITGSHSPYTVSAGEGASFVANTDGTVVAWGTDTTGQLGRTVTGTLTTPTLIAIPGTTPITLTGPPVQIVSRAGETYALVDAEIARSGEPNPYDFGMAEVPSTDNPTPAGPSHLFRLTDVATNKLNVSSTLYVDGANPGDFTLTNNQCTAGTTLLVVDGACTVTVTFHPTSAGSRQASLVLRTSNTLGGVLLSAFVPLVGNGVTPAASLANFSVDLAAGSPSTLPGRGNRIPISALDPALIPEAVPSSGASATIGKVQLLPTIGKITIGKVQLLPTIGKITIGKVPADATIGKVTIGKVTIGKVGLASAQLLPTIGKITIGKVPLLTLGGWAEFVKDYPALANLPVSSITFDELLAQGATSTVAAPGDRITLGDLDLRNSFLAQASFLGLLMGQVQLSQYPVDWCDELAPFESPASCTGAGLQRSLFSLSLANHYPLDAFKATGLTVGQVTPLVAGADPWKDAVWPLIKLSSVTIPGTHLDLPLTAIPDANLATVLDCSKTDCANKAGRKLGDADVLLALRPDAVFSDLGPALNPLKIAWLAEPFLDRGAFPWEALPRDLIPLQAFPNRLTAQFDVDVNCSKVSGTELHATLPAGYDYVPSTATLTRTRGSGTVAVPASYDKASRRVTVSVPDSSFSATGPIACSTSSATYNAAHLTVRIGVLPGDTAQAGTARIGGDISTGTLTATDVADHGVTLTGLYDPPGASPSGPAGAADELVLGEIAHRNQVQYLPFDVAPGKTVEATLSQLHADLDLVLYHPVGAALDPLLAGSTTAQPVPFGEAPFVDADPRYTPSQASGGALQDVPIRSDRPVAAVSALRNKDDEQLSTVARPGSADNRYLLQVSGFGEGTSTYTVRIRLSDQASLGQCTISAPTVGYPSSVPTFYASSGPAVPGFNADDDTVVLVNKSRLDAYFGAGQGQNVLTAAYNLTHGGGIKGQVLQLDSTAASQIKAAYQALDGDPTQAMSPSRCDPDKSNAVVKAINDFVYGLLPSSVKYVVILGGHEVGAPHALPIDTTRDGNEREEAGDLALTGNNPLANAFALGRYPTDAPYGTKHPLSMLGQVVYVPQLAVGRVGEDPASIVAQLAAYTAANGRADPPPAARTATVTDYDFLTGGGNKVAAALSGDFTVNHDLTGVGARWTKADLDARWLGRNPVPDIGVLNMHYDQYRALPALGNATNDLSDLYKAADVANGPSLTQRVVLTVGCHSALNVPDRWSDASTLVRAQDWAQRYGEKGLAVMVGNLGFGYADSSVVAFSALEQQYLAEAMAQHRDMGFSLVQAQQTYARGMVSLSPYDLKSLQEMVLWGLPQYRTTDAPAQAQSVAAASVQPTVTDPATGAPSRTIDVGTPSAPLQFRTVVDPGGSTHVEASTTGADPWRTASVSGHPILPLVTVPVTEEPGMSVTSVVPVGITTTADVTTSSTFARAGTDEGVPPQPTSDGDYPATLGHVMTIPGIDGDDSSLAFTPGQIHLDGSGPGRGTVRTIPVSQWRVLYGPAGTAYRPDLFTRVDAVIVPVNGSAPAVTSYTVDLTPADGATTKEVYVLARPSSGSGDWVRTVLQLIDGHWVGGHTGELGEFFVVSTNSYLSSAISTLKGANWYPHVVNNGGDLSALHFSSQPNASGWYVVRPTVTADSGTIWVDGSPVGTSYTFTDGEHVVTYQRPDGTFVTVSGTTAFLAVLVDSITPTLSVTFTNALPPFPDDGGRIHPALRSTQPFTATATFGPSGGSVVDNGIALSGGGRGLDTGAPGLGSLQVTATSVAGRTASFAQAYRVVYDPRSSGFLSPVVSSPDGLNLTIRTLVYGFSYHLVDANNANVTTGAGSGNAFAFTDIGCPSTNNTIQLPKLTSATAQPVHTGNGNWLWDLQMPDPGNVLVCRHLRITVNDGYTHFDADLQIAP